jgi:hypothetical protein
MTDLSPLDFDNMTPSEFSDRLPELFASQEGKLSEDPKLAKFLAANPDAAGLVRDLEAIADAAKSLFAPEADVEPSDSLWSKIASKLDSKPDDLDESSDALPSAN